MFVLALKVFVVLLVVDEKLPAQLDVVFKLLAKLNNKLGSFSLQTTISIS